MNNLRHVGIFVKNLDSMVNFYKNLFDMEIVYDEIEQGDYLQSLTQLGSSVAFHIIKMKNKSGFVIELLQYISSKCIERSIADFGFSHLAVSVENLDVLYKKLKSEGIVFNTNPLLSPYGNVKVCFCRDPENNFLELVEDIKN